MSKVIILKGLPASGKTTYANEVLDKNFGSYKRVSKDFLRGMLDNGQFSKEAELFIQRARNLLILAALSSGEGKNVIIDDTNLNPKHEEEIRELVEGRAEVEIKYFDIDLDMCIQRNKERNMKLYSYPNPVTEKVIRESYERWIKPEIEKRRNK